MKSEILNRRSVTVSNTKQTRWGPVTYTKTTIIRELSCGHEQEQPQGGESHTAHDAICKTCPKGRAFQQVKVP